MAYEIVADPDTSELLIREVHDPRNVLYLPSTRDLLLLRARLNSYVDTMQADVTLPVHDALPEPRRNDPENPYISTVQAIEIAQAKGIDLNEDTLQAAMRRGRVATAHKRGGRWFVQQAAFLQWLKVSRVNQG